MPVQLPIGSYHLKRGVRLIKGAEGGILLKSSPLRALRINRAAAAILESCQRGCLPGCDSADGGRKPPVAFLDALHQAGLLDWVPAPPKHLPMVSIVIPVYRRPAEIEQCLAALQSLDYPTAKREIIVVDDASPDHTAAVVRRFGVRLIVQPRNKGQSAARNTGVAAARGEIIAFLDSDCIAGPGWLRELVPYFQDGRVALVGGRVGAWAGERWMDRYEAVCSALNMGNDPVMGRGANSVFYVPTCNMLVRKAVYAQAGGLDERLHVGEDVDFCWRLLSARHHLHYVPRGEVLHKHRNRWWPGFLRRFDYGTSEAVLYSRFPNIVKKFTWQPAGLGIMLSGIAALVTWTWIWLVVMAGILAVETGCKRRQLIRKTGIRLSSGEILTAEIKDHFRVAFYLAFILVRYHLLVLIALSFCLPSQVGLWLTVIILPTVVTYLRKRPRLSFPVFAFFYLAEHAFYQSGAFWGCVKQRCFRLYRISLRYAGFMQRSNRPAAIRPPNGITKASGKTAMRPS